MDIKIWLVYLSSVFSVTSVLLVVNKSGYAFHSILGFSAGNVGIGFHIYLSRCYENIRLHLPIEETEYIEAICLHIMLRERYLVGSCLVKHLVCLVVDEAHRATGNYSYCVAVREVCSVSLT